MINLMKKKHNSMLHGKETGLSENPSLGPYVEFFAVNRILEIEVYLQKNFQVRVRTRRIHIQIAEYNSLLLLCQQMN